MKPHTAYKLQQYRLDQYYENGSVVTGLVGSDIRKVMVYLQRMESRRMRTNRAIRRCIRFGKQLARDQRKHQKAVARS
jgi:hypothetical protein